jgi:copper chaperone CopZ
MVETIFCVHCGAIAKHPVTKTIGGQPLAFCCGGCLQVYEMLVEEGLAPQPSSPIPARSTNQPSGPTETILLPVQGMSCAHCVMTVEAGLRATPGVVAAKVDLAEQRAVVEVVSGQVTPARLRQAVKDSGYESPEDDRP